MILFCTIKAQYCFCLRMGFLEAAVTLGTLMGTFLSSYIFNLIGYVGIFGSCSAIVAFVAIYTYYLIPESVVVKKIDVSVLLGRIKRFFPIFCRCQTNCDKMSLILLFTEI